MKIRFFLLLSAILGCHFFSFAQKKENKAAHVNKVDSASVKKTAEVEFDSTGKKKHSPHKATMHSLILPGWGQAYNRKYWKIPIIYAGLGITGYIFNYNRVTYNKVKYAYFAVVNRGTADSVYFPVNKVAPEWQAAVADNDSYGLQTYRNQVRKDIDYSVLFFLFFWALNVVDATVDGHLKDFDVSNDLSLHIKPAFYTIPSAPLGISLTLNLDNKNAHHKMAPLP